MKRIGSLFRREKIVGSADADRQVWRPYEDQPLNLTAPQRGDTATGQRALVLGFAALAVAGATYFGTVMLTHQIDDDDVSFFSEADAATKPSEPATQPPEKSADAAASAPDAPSPTKPKPIVAAKPTTKVAAASSGNPLVPIPVKVTTITIPAKPAALRTPPQPVALSPEQANTSGTELVAKAEPVSADPHAYTEETRRMMSEGVEAVLREVTGASPSKKTVVVASANTDDPAVTDSNPEMAGSAPVGARQGRIRSAVNMRSRPVSGSRVLGVIPTNSVVSLAPGCRDWCKVSYQGRTGYIYKSFLR